MRVQGDRGGLHVYVSLWQIDIVIMRFSHDGDDGFKSIVGEDYIVFVGSWLLRNELED